MAASSSDDASDIFWPGYVDAIANLAINLLFVIAVMAIVVIGASLQIAELMKRKDNGYLQEVAGNRQQHAQLPNPGTATAKADLLGQRNIVSPTPVENATGTPQKNSSSEASGGLHINKNGYNQSAKLQSDLEKLQEAYQQLQIKLNQAKSAQRIAEQQALEAMRQKAQSQATPHIQGGISQTKTQAKASIESKSETAIEDSLRQDKTEIVEARSVQSAQSGQGITAVNVRASGLLVRFKDAALELSPNEAVEVLAKLNTFGPLATTRWRITVVAPKGFSEALRLAYYRANTVRNVLVVNGVSGSVIDLRVIESTGDSADNTLVSVRPQP